MVSDGIRLTQIQKVYYLKPPGHWALQQAAPTYLLHIQVAVRAPSADHNQRFSCVALIYKFVCLYHDWSCNRQRLPT